MVITLFVGFPPPNFITWLFCGLKVISHVLPYSAQMSDIFCRPEHDADNKEMSSAYKKNTQQTAGQFM